MFLKGWGWRYKRKCVYHNERLKNGTHQASTTTVVNNRLTKCEVLRMGLQGEKYPSERIRLRKLGYKREMIEIQAIEAKDIRSRVYETSA